MKKNAAAASHNFSSASQGEERSLFRLKKRDRQRHLHKLNIWPYTPL
jgi:hypothetical protein